MNRAIHHIKRSAPAREFVKFGIVGLLTTAVNFTIYSVLVLGGVYYLLAAVIAFAVATLNSYTFNRRWTFRSGEASRRQLVKFTSVQLGGLTLNLIALALLVEYGGFEDHKLMAQLLANSVVVGSNFAGNKLWTFRR